MCGIVAVTGYKKALPLLMNGLEKLEYRGYDSAGIAIINSETNSITCNKAEGKLKNLKRNLNNQNISGTVGIGMVYLVSILMNMFGGTGISLIHSNGLFGIGFSLFVVAMASLNLVLDFDFIEDGAEKGMPKYMEWYGAFALMVTLIWLYMEILRLLAKLRR